MYKYIICLVALLLTGCAELNNPYGNDPYNRGNRDPYYRDDGYYGNYPDRYPKRPHRDGYWRDNDRRDYDHDRDRDHDRRDSGWGHDKRNEYHPPAPTPAPERERCPSGFSESERKCSTEERRRGCKDIRMPGGLGCVKR